MSRHLPESIPEQLPPCEGPKLGFFQYHDSRIQWLERLDEEDGNSSCEGYVFRARIRGREYAIKVFKFYDPMSTEYFWGPLIGEDTPLITAAYYTDPFYAECRAYGRIREAVKKRVLRPDVAIPCHGFFFLQPKDQQVLKDRNIDLGLDKVDPDYQHAAIGGRRARAIVKDLASSDSGVHENNLQKILSGIAMLNGRKIYNMDIRLGNYRDGKIADFGSSWTEPHALLNAMDDKGARVSRLADRVMFDQMIEDEEIPNPKQVKAMHSMKLRPRKA